MAREHGKKLIIREESTAWNHQSGSLAVGLVFVGRTTWPDGNNGRHQKTVDGPADDKSKEKQREGDRRDGTAVIGEGGPRRLRVTNRLAVTSSLDGGPRRMKVQKRRKR
jgi:hypothetical protein